MITRILLLTPQLPYPPRQGTSIRNWHMLRSLAEFNEVTLLSFVDSQVDAADIARLAEAAALADPVEAPARSTARRLGQFFLSANLPDLALRLQSEAFKARLRLELETASYDAVQIEGLELAGYLKTVRVSSSAAIVLDCHNAETVLQQRATAADFGQWRRWPAAAYSRVQGGRLAAFERWACRAADHVLAVSASDRAHLRKLAGGPPPPITVVPNSIEVGDYAPISGRLSGAPEFDIVFTGKMDYRPNVDAMLWFAGEVWPGIVGVEPQTTFAIVGQKPHPRLDPLRAMPNISVTGEVPDIGPYLAGSKVYIAPLRMGSGTRLKLMQAMAAGQAIVSTTLAAEGLDVVSGRELLLADTPGEMAAAILGLLADDERRRLLGQNARLHAQRFDWRNNTGILRSIYDELLSRTDQSR